MNYTHIISSTFIAVLACLVFGCVNHITITDAARHHIEFASPLTAQTFYDAYLSAAEPKGRGSMTVYLPLPYSHTTISTDNVRFNSAAQVADANCDGTISENEARAFAANAHIR